MSSDQEPNMYKTDEKRLKIIQTMIQNEKQKKNHK